MRKGWADLQVLLLVFGFATILYTHLRASLLAVARSLLDVANFALIYVSSQHSSATKPHSLDLVSRV